MQLPHTLRQTIEETTAQRAPNALSQAATELSDRYRTPRGSKGRFITGYTHRLAYLATRFPATYAAMSSVLLEVQRRAPDQSIASLLDLGVGPGTARWAATQQFSTLEKITLVEQDPGLIAVGKSLAQNAKNELLFGATWT